MKTRQEHIDDLRHDLSGIMLDAILNDRRGAELSIAMRLALRKIDLLSAALYDAICPPSPVKPASNGVAQPTKPVAR
jgi:hypothetical protein